MSGAAGTPRGRTAIGCGPTSHRRYCAAWRLGCWWLRRWIYRQVYREIVPAADARDLIPWCAGSMTTATSLDSATEFVLAGARGAAGNGRVGTEHLLIGLSGRVGKAAGAALEAVDVTRRVLVTVVGRREEWISADEADLDPDSLSLGAAEWYDKPDKPMDYTTAARAAMQRAVTDAGDDGRSAITPVDVLLGLLQDEDNRATEVLTACGVNLPTLRRALLAGQPPDVADPVEPELRRTRDLLLGRARFRGLGVLGRLFGRLPMFIYHAEAPVLWTMWEAQDQARRDGRRRPNTDDVLLALLATYEVAQRYPHLVGRAQDRYDGGQLLTAAGVRHGDARSAARTHAAELGFDPRPVKAYAPPGDRYPRTTGELLDAITRDGDTRAARLLRILGLEVPLAPA